MKHTEEDLAYAAGFLDGEACFKFTNGTPEVVIDNTYVHTLVWFSEMFGGSCRTKIKPQNPKWRQAYSWAVTGDNARNCINAVLPYLKEKLPQAKILLEISAYPPRSHKRAQLNQELRKLKRINYEWNLSNSSQPPPCSPNSTDDSTIQSSLPLQR